MYASKSSRDVDSHDAHVPYLCISLSFFSPRERGGGWTRGGFLLIRVIVGDS